MPSVASLIAKGVITPPPVAPALIGQFDPSVLLGPSYATMRKAWGVQSLLHEYAGNTVAAATKMLGKSCVPPAVFGEIDTTARFWMNQQGALATTAGVAIAAVVKREAYGSSGINDAILAAGIGPTVAAITGVADSQAALMSMQSGVGHWADSLTRLTQDIARLGAVGNPPLPHPIPAIHIRRAPALLPLEVENPLIAPERGRRCMGRPRGSYLCTREDVVSTYKELKARGGYVTQERLAHALGVELRTLQRYLTLEHMGLGWPPEL